MNNKISLPGNVETHGLGKIKKPISSKQIGCEAGDARFIPCVKCLYNNDMNGCYKTRREGNLKIVISE